MGSLQSEFKRIAEEAERNRREQERSKAEADNAPRGEVLAKARKVDA